MFKRFLLTTFLISALSSLIYPTKKENTDLFDYCYSLEKILYKNSITKKVEFSKNINSIAKDLSRFSLSKTKGTLVNQIINQYKEGKNSYIINLIPNKIYCFTGYWIENINPGTFEKIFYERSKRTINEFKDFKDEIDSLIKNINTEYKIIKEEIDIFLK